MQNKPNLVRRRRIANSVFTREYERKCNWTLGENKPNSNPIKPNLKRAKMNINLTLTKDYRKKDDFAVRINKPNFRKAQNEHKLIYSKGLQKKNDFAARINKPNSNPILKISILNYVNLRKLFPPKSSLFLILNPAFQRLSLRPPGGLFSQLTAQPI